MVLRQSMVKWNKIKNPLLLCHHILVHVRILIFHLFPLFENCVCVEFIEMCNISLLFVHLIFSKEDRTSRINEKNKNERTNACISNESNESKLSFGCSIAVNCLLLNRFKYVLWKRLTKMADPFLCFMFRQFNSSMW